MNEIKICPNCKKEFLSKTKKKKYCCDVCYVCATSKKRAKDKDPKFLIWNDIKIKNGCFAKTMTSPDHIYRRTK